MRLKAHDESICPKIKGECTCCTHVGEGPEQHHYCDLAAANVEDLDECPEEEECHEED